MFFDDTGNSASSVIKKIFGALCVIALVAIIIASAVVTGGASIAAMAVGAVIGAGTSFLSQGITNVASGKGFFEDMSITAIAMGALSGAAFASGLGGLIGAIGIGFASSAGTAALEDKSWKEIFTSGVVGGTAAGIGYGIGQALMKNVFKTDGMTFSDFYKLGRVDVGAVKATVHAFCASWYKFLPAIAPGITRGILKFLGDKGLIQWLR